MLAHTCTRVCVLYAHVDIHDCIMIHGFMFREATLFVSMKSIAAPALRSRRAHPHYPRSTGYRRNTSKWEHLTVARCDGVRPPKMKVVALLIPLRFSTQTYMLCVVSVDQ